MEDILNLAISSGLNFPIRRNYDFSNVIHSRVIPNNTFGVFVSVERSKNHTLKSWPGNIHGCIGYWDPNYNIMNNDLIIDKIISCANDSVWKDNRRSYFKKSIYVDLKCLFKIYFMLLPIKKINNESGEILNTKEIFNNNRYGLIVEGISDNQNRATYLPNVFPNESWEFIKKSIIQKAGISNSEIRFYAYDCKIYSMTVSDYFIRPIQYFINKHYTNFVPYKMVNDYIIIDKSEYVRNLAFIYDVLQMNQYGYSINNTVYNSITSNINYYKHKFNLDKKSMRQASAFLLLDIYLTNTNDQYFEIIKSYLYDQIINPDFNNPIDINFELGEILMALSIVDKKNNILAKKLNKIPNIDQNAPVDIFRYNWFSKLVINIDYPDYKLILTNKIIKFIDNHPQYDETNFYAVEFESLSTLYTLINDPKLQSLVEKYISELLIKLENRRNIFGMFHFKNGDVRFDITGHILNGYYALLSILT